MRVLFTGFKGEKNKMSKNDEFINITEENVDTEHLSCIIRSRKPHPGVEAKRCWLKERLKEGHVFRKLNVKAPVFIEYAPLEKAWVPIVGENYYYIYCLWTEGAEYRGKGYGKQLLEYCIEDAKTNGKSGVCVLGAKKQKAWLTNQEFCKGFGFEVVDTTENGYELLALSFDGTTPAFTDKAKQCTIENQELTVYYDFQCPFIHQTVEAVRQFCTEKEIPVQLIQLESLQQAKELPCVFNNWGLFYRGKFESVNLMMDLRKLEKMIL